jgi:glycerol kinase
MGQDAVRPSDSGIELASLKVDGGATVNDFLMQLQADVLGVKVVHPTVRETTTCGQWIK